MSQPERTSDQWKISVRAPGEILTSMAREDGIELGLLGVPGGYTCEEIQGWLHDLIGVARETSGSDTESRGIPAMLHHGLTGLLFSHEQLWNQDGQTNPVSYAFVAAPDWVGFGWIGDIDVQVWVDGEAIEPEAVIVRDEAGNEGRAFVANASHGLVIRLSWPVGVEETHAATVVADWAGADAAATEAAPSQTDRAQSAPAETAPRHHPAASTVEPHVEPASVWFDESHAPVQIPATAVPSPFPTAEPAIASAAPLAPDVSEPVGLEVAAQEPGDFMQPAPAIDAAAYYEVDEQRNVAVETLEASAATDPTFDAGSDAPSDDMTAKNKRSPLRRIFGRLAFWKRVDEHMEANAELAADAATHLDDEFLEHIPGVPDQVPPTPEPAELTERTVAYAPGLPKDLRGDAPATPDVNPAVVDLPDSPFFEIAADAFAVEAQLPMAAPAMQDWAPGDVAFEDAQPMEAFVPLEDADPVAPELQMQPEPPAAALHPEVNVEPQVEEPPAMAEDVAPLPAMPPQGEQLEAAALTEAFVPANRVPMRPEWPSAEDLAEPTPIWKRPIAWAAVIAALFAGGWLVGHFQQDGTQASAPGGVQGMLRGIGLGGTHFEVMVNSRPPGAWIAVDGEDIAQRTPASVELPPGEHQITLSFSDHGGAAYDVRGVDGDQLSVDAVLWGSVNVYSSNSAVPVAVSVDGDARGFAPMSVDSLAPGTHELRFSGPGLPSWGQTVQVRVQEAAEVVARPMTSPATGLIEVRATTATMTGSDPLEGAEVWVDGRPEGVTPLSIELPRGPHSIRVTSGGESSPVQVIDLPGGNQRFARFQLGLNSGAPRLQTIDPPAAVALDRSSVLSVALDQVALAEVKEIWLHVQTTNGTWRRYEMAVMKSPDGVVGVTVFPNTQFDDKGLVRFYASARTYVGDEYYTEIQRAKAAR